MDNETKLKLMRFWLFGTFLIIFAAVTVYIGVVIGAGMSIFGDLNYWLAIGATAVLTILWYYLYRWILNR